jgi:L-lactate dehydrogenase complex protein LldG
MVATALNSDQARAAILDAIAKANGAARATSSSDALPEPMLAVDATPNVVRQSLAHRFRDELARLGGETRFVRREEDLPAAIAAFVSERGLKDTATDSASADYAVLRAESLLADTGSAIVVERNAERRLAPYLPRTCIIVADSAALYDGMNAEALRPVLEAARGRDRGEALIITGPSRTSDIEKVLVLGAHGPRNVVVFIVNVEGE